jgi:very-short-patch-repair endonuclease
VDGRESHATHRAFQVDRDRDAMLVAAGFRVMRFTWSGVTRNPSTVAGRLRRALGG